MSVQIEIPTSENDYVRTFDSSNQLWRNDTILYNYFFLKSQQNFFNQRLQVRGHVFLNEILIALGFDPTPVGSVVGWVIPGNGITFGIFANDTTASTNITEQATVGVKEIRLEFNVEGVIVNEI